jgi:hypothetical protein
MLWRPLNRRTYTVVKRRNRKVATSKLMKKGCRKFSSKVDENLSSSLSSSSVPDAAPAERSSALTVRKVWICFVKRKYIVTVVVN